MIEEMLRPSLNDRIHKVFSAHALLPLKVHCTVTKLVCVVDVAEKYSFKELCEEVIGLDWVKVICTLDWTHHRIMLTKIQRFILNVQNFCGHENTITVNNKASHDLWTLIHFDVWTCNEGVLSLIESAVNKTIGFQ